MKWMIYLCIWIYKRNNAMSNHNEAIKRLNGLLSEDNNAEWREVSAYRETNKVWLKKSTQIAIRINRILRESKLSQKGLASKMSVTPQQINKILKGKENLTLETISKLEIALGTDLISVLNKDTTDDQKDVAA